MNKILITGGFGFIGFNFIKMLLENKEDIFIINLDKMTYASKAFKVEKFKEFEKFKNYKTMIGDICRKKDIQSIIENHNVESIINFAAESHVDRSINEERKFLETNILGVLNLLQATRDFELERLLQVSTDEVYGSLGEYGKFDEFSQIKPNSPYSASKASADCLVNSFHVTYGLDTVITRSSNNYGPWQHQEKFIPLCISKALKNEKIPIYGSGKQVRDWIFVRDNCEAIWKVYQKGGSGEVYNIGGKCEKRNIDLAKKILEILGKSEDLIEYIEDRPGHDERYAIDFFKIAKSLKWVPKVSFNEELERTINWYKENL